MFPLVSASHLAEYIIGTVHEASDIEAAVAKYGSDIANRILNEDTTVEEIAGELCAKFQSEGVTMNTFTVENIYRDSSESLHNKAVWGGAKNLAAGRALVKLVSPLYFLAISTTLHDIRIRNPSSWINFHQANNVQISNCTKVLLRWTM